MLKKILIVFTNLYLGEVMQKSPYIILFHVLCVKSTYFIKKISFTFELFVKSTIQIFISKRYFTTPERTIVR